MSKFKFGQFVVLQVKVPYTDLEGNRVELPVDRLADFEKEVTIGTGIKAAKIHVDGVSSLIVPYDLVALACPSCNHNCPRCGQAQP